MRAGSKENSCGAFTRTRISTNLKERWRNASGRPSRPFRFVQAFILNSVHKIASSGMTILIDKPGFAAHLHDLVFADAGVGDLDGMRVLQRLAGILVETLLLFDDPDEGLCASIDTLCDMLNCLPADQPLTAAALPPAYLIDHETEGGRALARQLFEEWLDCTYEFHDLVIFTVHHVLLCLEEQGQDRRETLRLFEECSIRCLSYELAAQELCDLIIDQKMGGEGWSFSEGVSGLSAVAGRCLAMSQVTGSQAGKPVPPAAIDQVAYVMTQEAVRLGVPAGSDWRFGLAANDGPLNAPFDLIFNLWPACRDFFRAIHVEDLADQAVACAKAAGRLLAVAASGADAEISSR